MSPLFVLNSWTEHCSSDKSSTFCRFCSFPAFLHILTLSSSDCMILRSIFSHWGQLMDSSTTIKKGSNIHWCSRRTHDALRAGCWKLLNFFLLLKYIFFSIYYCPSEATEDTCMFPGRQIKYNLPWSSIQKVFTPPALNASCVLLEHQWMFEPFLIVVFESLNCPQCEKMDLKIIQSLLDTTVIIHIFTDSTRGSQTFACHCIYDNQGLCSFQTLRTKFCLPASAYFVFLQLRSALKAYGVPWSSSISSHPMRDWIAPSAGRPSGFLNI